jgi:pyridoxal phosphate enzyme (YggS family)
MTTFPLAGSLVERIAQIRQTLPASVRLIAVTKQVSVAAMREAYTAGIRDFGENRVQEAEVKQAELADLPDIAWHLIGHLQSNKAAKAIQQFQWIHSVDSLKLAQRLNQLAEGAPSPPNLCLQVKLLPDPNKFGWTVADLLADLPQLNACERVRIRGLMTIPPLELDDSEILDLFHQTADLADRINQLQYSHIQIQELSMGMSDDYLLAVKAGATMVRLGRILFGDRTN